MMTPREAEIWLGRKPSTQGRSLLNMALKRERERGVSIVESNGREGKARRYFFTKQALTEHMSDLLEDRYSRTAGKLGEAIDKLKAEIDARIDARIARNSVVLELQKQGTEALGLIHKLTEKVERFTSKSAG